MLFREDASVRKGKEKPSFISQRILDTQQRNARENIRLEKNLSVIEKEKWTTYDAHYKYKTDLNQVIAKIKAVRNKVPVSPERKRFLGQQGLKLKHKYYDSDYFLDLIDETLKPRRFKQASEKPRNLSDFLTDAKDEKIPNSDSVTIEQVDNNSSSCFDEEKEKRQKKTKPIPMRQISPPLRGREVWKVNEEHEEEKRTLSLTENIHERRASFNNSHLRRRRKKSTASIKPSDDENSDISDLKSDSSDFDYFSDALQNEDQTKMDDLWKNYKPSSATMSNGRHTTDSTTYKNLRRRKSPIIPSNNWLCVPSLVNQLRAVNLMKTNSDNDDSAEENIRLEVPTLSQNHELSTNSSSQKSIHGYKRAPTSQDTDQQHDGERKKKTKERQRRKRRTHPVTSSRSPSQRSNETNTTSTDPHYKYSQMQMTIGGRTVSVFVNKFKSC